MLPYINDFPIEFRDYIASEIIPRYADFDKAHRVDHVLKVIAESLKLSQYYDVSRMMVYVIASYHDLGLCEGREFHHLISGKILWADQKLRQWFPEEHILIMKEAVEDHRASNKHVPRSIYGKIVAEADRIIDPDITLRRTVQYGLSNYPELDKEKQYIRFLTHLKEKYAEGGYLRLWIPQSANAVHLQELRQLIADEEELHKVFEKIYSQETETIQNLENIPIFAVSYTHLTLPTT